MSSTDPFAPVFSDGDDLLCLCGAVLIPGFHRLVADAPDLFDGVNVPCTRCAGLGQSAPRRPQLVRPSRRPICGR